MQPRLVSSPSSAARLAAANDWLRHLGPTRDTLLIAPSLEPITRLTREHALAERGCFGWHRITFSRLAAHLASDVLAARSLAPAGTLAIEAVCARLVHDLSATGDLGRFTPIGDKPGLSRALARTMTELRLARAGAGDVGDADLEKCLQAFSELLGQMKLADRATIFDLATAVLERPHPLVQKPLLFLDVPIVSVCDRELVRALLRHSPEVLITAPSGDIESIDHLRALGLNVEQAASLEGPLSSVHDGLFNEDVPVAGRSDAVELFSAPGESRECVEIARRILREAERGVRFDRMAVVLRAPARYRAPLEEAFARAKIPAYFARGARRPNPAGRAFVALLACKAEGLSAVRFAEYLSLGQVPDATESGAPPPAAPAAERWAAPEHEFAPESTTENEETREQGDGEGRAVDPESVPVVAGTLRAPRAWERLLVDAAVIGGRDRWNRRLAGLRAELELDREECEDPEDPIALRITRELRALDSLQQYALPLLDVLDALPERATWGTWLEGLSELASRALRHPESVLRALSELAPMGTVGPVELREVQLVLEQRLLETITPSEGRSYGHVYVASTDEVRGLQFDVVFVPGLAEKIFPQKIADDPLLPDAARARSKVRLRTSRDRAAAERLALRLALGAARQRLVVSYPRLDLDQSRPRTASFYALEVVRAAEGALLGFDELAVRANRSSDARIGWPAPADPQDAIDDAEHDLAVLAAAVHGQQGDTKGAARYLLSQNAYLNRALRSRWYRWSRTWTAADGLVEAAPRARAALAAHSLAARSFSATALQNYAPCPYRFFLQAVHRLAPREEPASIERLDPMQRGSLIHEVQFALLNRLRDQLLLPVTPQNLERARELLDRTVNEVAARYADELSPAIERVWLDSIADIRTDLREWLRRMSEDAPWRPTHFELSFALERRRAHDPSSTREPVALSCGIRLRGSIDLVETSASGTVRATDHKTGKVRAHESVVIDGGKVLQPVLYALALERVMPHARVESGRLYYCTHAGEFESVTIPLDDSAREGAKLVADTIDAAIMEAFLPAAPEEGACTYCDYQSVCGPHEELRTRRKRPERLEKLVTLRGHR